MLAAQVQRLEQAVHRSTANDPFNRRNTADIRLLNTLRAVMFDQVPADPWRMEYQPGHCAVLPRSRWRCAPCGADRFSVYFQVDQACRKIIYGWVADRTCSNQPALEDAPYVLFGNISVVTAEGKVALPYPVRDMLQMRSAGRLSFWMQGASIVAGAAMPPIRSAATA